MTGDSCGFAGGGDDKAAVGEHIVGVPYGAGGDAEAAGHLPDRRQRVVVGEIADPDQSDEL